jgi:glycosyltransferase involved in cell wall biosynthesis
MQKDAEDTSASGTLLPVSVHILTWNSGKTLERALQSVLRCKEILIIDGGSTDDTLRIAATYGAKVVLQRPPEAQGSPLTDFSAARNVGLAHTTEPWILVLDSDEWASEELMDDIEAVSQFQTVPAAYLVPRKYVLPNGRVVTHASTYPNERVYFFHRNAAHAWRKPVHERPDIAAGIPTLRLHGASLAPLGTVQDYIRKNTLYLRLEIEHMPKGWRAWGKQVRRAIRGQILVTLRLLKIWLVPHGGVRLPLRQEFIRWWYRWTLVWHTFPPVRQNRY